MKKVVLIVLLLLSSSSIKLNNLKPILNIYQQCKIDCKFRNSNCIGVFEKTIFDGTTELSPILKKEIFSVCAFSEYSLTVPTGI